MSEVVELIFSKKEAALLFLILAIASFFRFYEITERGLYLYDEATYAIFLRDFRSISDWAISNIGDILAMKPDYESLSRVFYPDKSTIWLFPTAKLGSVTIFIIFSFFFGVHDYVVSAASAFFGVLTITLLYFFAKKYYGIKVALWSALLLSISGFHVYYSRSANVMTISSFFILLGTFLYLRFLETKTLRYRFLAGLAMGFSFLANYNFIVSAAVFGFYELVVLCKEIYETRGLRWRNIGSLAFPFGFFLIIYIYEETLILLRKAIAPHISNILFNTFSELLKMHYSTIAGEGGKLDLFYHIEFIPIVDGIPYFILFCLGVLLLARKVYGQRRWSDGVVLTQIVLPLSAYALLTAWAAPVPRVISSILPFGALAAGFGIWQMEEKIAGFRPYGKWIFFGFVLVVVLSSSYYAWRMTSLDSGYKKASDFILGIGKEKGTYPINMQIYDFYLEDRDLHYAAPTEVFADSCKRYMNGMTQYLVVDYTFYGLRLGFGLDEVKPIATFENPIGKEEVVAAEQGYGREQLKNIVSGLHSDKIEIYRLEDIYGNRTCR